MRLEEEGELRNEGGGGRGCCSRMARCGSGGVGGGRGRITAIPF